MASSLTPLTRLRQDIDRIDDAIHDLLMERALVVREIGKAKPRGGSPWRPAREAAILRRLLARHEGDLPRMGMVRLWREITGIFASMQGEVQVTALQSQELHVRSFFGGLIKFTAASSAEDAMNEVAVGHAAIGVLPWPDGHQNWWIKLPAGIYVAAALPFANIGESPKALAFSCAVPDATGDDCTLVAVRDGTTLPDGSKSINSGSGWTLIQVPYFISRDDAAFHGDGIRYVGAFATPILLA